ncbi:WD40-repeat-containing domain protein [Rhodocollybia butyracea]|uniref:WD40-repeat-containing domain protein n=1 Tax=Rhodocollybia butyracea TaxID=206335 RepID=A0A9P5PER3_9AGAR|nr:WD40-repeat-containing domain protein [Rhodocollybia butyracea]
MKPSTALKSNHDQYMLQKLLTGHQGPVSCITAHPLGTHIATGGEKGTNIWNLETSALVAPPTRAGEPSDVEDGLAYGTEDGYLCIWKKDHKEDKFMEIYCDCLTGGKDGQEIAAMAYDTSSNQLAVVHQAESVHRFVIDGSMYPRTIKSVSIPKHWPQGVAFGQVGMRGPSFGPSEGRMELCHYILNDNGKVLSTKTTGTVIGHAVLNVKEDAILLDDVSQGVALYKLSGAERVKTFEVPSTQCRMRDIAFHDGCGSIISGSDHGNVYVFDCRTGSINDVIRTGVKDCIRKSHFCLGDPRVA